MTNLSKLMFVLSVATAGCGDDGPNGPSTECGAGTTLVAGECVSDIDCGAGTTLMGGQCVPNGGSNVTCGSGTMLDNGMCVATPPTRTFTQVEHLARPGINEALLITNDFLAGYNATAPTYAGVPPAVLDQVIAEAKTVLKALYLGTCLLNGAAGLTAATGLKPAGITCHAVGPAIWTENTLAGVTLTAASQTAAQTYADAVFGLFIPDVMRVDTSAASRYETFCGGANVGLCGGRLLNDDVIDTTYDFLLNGAMSPKKAAFNQFSALVSDGVVFDNVTDANNSDNRVVGNPNNAQQGHPAITATFPYSAAPL